MSTTTEQLTEVQQKIAQAEAQAQEATEADRERLAQLQAQAAAEAHEEDARQAGRRQAWARHYLATEHTAEAGQARKDATAARREFEKVLAAQPWVAALLDWQEALNAQHAATRRAEHARRLLGQPVTATPDAPNVLPMLDGEVRFTPIGRVLHFLAEQLDKAEPSAEVDALAAHADGKGDPLAEALTAVPVDRDADPLAHLARNGARLDVNRHDTDNGEVIVHRNPQSGEWVQTDAGGTVLATSWTTAKAENRPSNPIDGREHGTEFDPEAGKFAQVRRA